MSLRLHLGCGKRFIPGYTHVDVVDFPHITVKHSIDSLPFVQDGAAEVVYACHVLEHFNRAEAHRVLIEWRRVLAPGGVLRLAVPDFAALCELYARTGDINLVHGPLFGRQDYLYNIHFAVYDERSLRALLERCGFKDVRRYDWRATEHADVDDYASAYFPHLDQTGLLLSLNVEATRP